MPVRPLFPLLAVLLATAFGFAQQPQDNPPAANYKLALKFSAKNLAPMTYTSSVFPNWIGKSDSFWYTYRTSKGIRYWLVDSEKKSKKPLFDHDKLAEQLAELSRNPVAVESLTLTSGQVSDNGKFTFNSGGMRYEYDLKTEKLVSKGKAPAQPSPSPFGEGKQRRFGSEDGADMEDQEDAQDLEKGDMDKGKEDTDKIVDKTKGKQPPTPTRSSSPDRKAYLFLKDRDLYLAETSNEKEPVRLSKDSAENYSFSLFAAGGGGGFFGKGKGKGANPTSALNRSIWDTSSKFFHVARTDSRNLKDLFLVNSIATPRPTLETYKYPMPGEETVRKSEFYIGSRDAKAITRIKPKWKDESYFDIHWGRAPGELRFVRRDRVLRNLELCAVDVARNECRTLIHEGFEAANVVYEPLRYLESGEMIWWSEKSGWGHYYLYDSDGKLKNAITSGAWRASNIVALDEKTRTLYIRGNAREKGENVYYEHLYKVNLDGTGLTLLNPGDAHHSASLSPTRRVLVDNTSRVDRAPESVLRDASTGTKIMDLERTDLSRLTEYGWQAPETFVVKAADGVTDLYGVMWKPFNFDPKKKYPIIAHVYPGPQTEGVNHLFSVASTNLQLAQLGFIVVQVGHRGGTPTRSKAYASFGYWNLRDYALIDKKTALEQLAARFSWIDLQRVGIYGHSGGAFMSAAAMMVPPYNDFFKVAVASAGNHDNNIYNNLWSERYHGMKEVPIKEEVKAESKDKTRGPGDMEPVAPPRTNSSTTTTTTKKEEPVAPPRTKYEIKVPTNAEMAANLKGRLLLVHGEIDSNVHPANTMRLADALIKANKRFDLLIIPGQRHSFGTMTPYFTQRKWEFFAEHLLGDRRRGADMKDLGGE